MVCSACQKEGHPAKSCFDSARSVPIAAVLGHYGIEYAEKRSAKGLAELRTKSCPFPNHKGKSPGALSIERDSAKFKCFSCHTHGRGSISLVAQVEGIPDKDAAERINAWFHSGTGGSDIHHGPQPTREPEMPPETPLVNVPLAEKFKDKGWDGKLKLEYHPYLQERGFSKELCEEMGVGFASKGKMAGRVAFPISNVDGQLVAYCGRAVDPSLEPRWYQPAGFHKSLELYNLHKVVDAFDDVILVESFWGVAACIRAGIPNAVALMGRELSPAQEEHLGRFRSVVLMLDGDAPGREAMKTIGLRLVDLAHWQSVKLIYLPDEWTQPDLLDAEVLQSLLF